MTDSIKIRLIEHVVVDALEYGEGENADFYRGVIHAISSICDYKEREHET